METDICRMIDAYLSGELGHEERTAFASHLAMCTKCQELQSQSQSIEDILCMRNSSIFMRPQFQSQLLTSLDRVEPKPKPHLDQIKWRAAAGMGVTVVAASLLYAVFSASNQSLDKSPINQSAPENHSASIVPQTQISPMEAGHERVVQAVAVTGSPGYLCARIDSDEPDIQFFIVRPVLQKH